MDSGFRSLWKAPRLPRAKKAFLAFLTFSFTDFDADRFDCHHTPRHFAAGVVSTLCPMIPEVGGFWRFSQLHILKH